MPSEKDHHSGLLDVEATPPPHSQDTSDPQQDVAIAMVGEQPHEIDPVVAARAVCKIDWFLIPAMIFGCSYAPKGPVPAWIGSER